MNLLLKDATNLQMNSSKRACTCKAVAIILQHTTSQKSHGPSVSGGTNSWHRESEVLSREYANLMNMLKDVIMEMQMAFAIQIFSIAVREGILEAASCAANVIDMSAYTVQMWASNYFLSLLDVTPDSIQLRDIEDRLLSDRGKLAYSQ